MVHGSSLFVTVQKLMINMTARCSRRCLLIWLALTLLSLPLTTLAQSGDNPRPAPVTTTLLSFKLSIICFSMETFSVLVPTLQIHKSPKGCKFSHRFSPLPFPKTCFVPLDQDLPSSYYSVTSCIALPLHRKPIGRME